MKKLSLITVILIFCYISASAQPCLPEGIIFTTQSQIDSFPINYPGCTEIEGDVKIYGDDITNLDGMNNVTSIGGTLQIGNDINMTGANPVLISLEGLSNLSVVGGDLEILGNDILVDLSGLENLTSMGGSLVIGGWWNTWPVANLSLLSLDGLDNLISIGDGIQIYGGGIFGYGVEDISALSGLTSINGDVDLRFLPTILNLDGLHNISFIGGNLSLGLLGLKNLSGLDELSYIAGGFGLNGNDSLISLTGLTQLDSIGGGLGIWSNYFLENLVGFENVISIGGNVGIGFNDTLTSLTGLENIDAASIGNLEIRNNNILSTCEVQSICDYLAAPGGDVIIENNAAGCNNPEEVLYLCDPTSIYETPKKTHFYIYPNPCSGAVHLRYSISDPSTSLRTGSRYSIFELYSIEGVKAKTLLNELQQPGEYELEFDVSDLPGGLYFLRMQVGDYYVTEKVVVIH